MVHGCCRLSGSAGSVGLRRSSSVTRRTPCNIRSCTVCQVRATFDRTSNSPDAMCLAIPGIPCCSSGDVLVCGRDLLCVEGSAIVEVFSAALDFNDRSVRAELVVVLVLCTLRSLGSASAQRRLVCGRPAALGAVSSLAFWKVFAVRLAAPCCWSATRTFSDSASRACTILCMHDSGNHSLEMRTLSATALRGKFDYATRAKIANCTVDILEVCCSCLAFQDHYVLLSEFRY